MSKKGMSLVTLTVTLVILILIISTIVVSGISSVESAKKTSFGIEIKNIQEVVDEYRVKTGEAVPIIKTITLNTSGITSTVITEQFVGETIPANKLELNVIDLSKLGIKDIKYGRGETNLDYYAISTTTNKVYYPAGIKAGGKVYYTLTADLNKAIGKNDIAATTKNSVTFTSNTDISKWTNTAVQVTIKVPEGYTVAEGGITATNDVSIYKEAENNVYTINKDNAITNYTITVSYTDTAPEPDVSKQAVYKVTKVDAAYPVIATPVQKYNIDSGTNTATAYITGINVTDDASGVKEVKYIKGTVNSNVVLKDFFEQYGTNVTDNKIQIEKGATSYTIYAEDNAGNYVVINVAIMPYIQSILW